MKSTPHGRCEHGQCGMACGMASNGMWEQASCMQDIQGVKPPYILLTQRKCAKIVWTIFAQRKLSEIGQKCPKIGQFCRVFAMYMTKPIARERNRAPKQQTYQQTGHHHSGERSCASIHPMGALSSCCEALQIPK